MKHLLKISVLMMLLILVTGTIAAADPIFIPLDEHVPVGTKLKVNARSLNLRSIDDIDEVVLLLQRDAVLYLLEYGQEYSKVRTEGGVEGLCATAYLLAEVALQTSTPAATPTITPEITPTPTVEIPRETEPVNTQEPSVTPSPQASVVPAVYTINKPNIIDNLAKVPKWVYIQIGAVAVYFIVRYFIKLNSKSRVDE